MSRAIDEQLERLRQKLLSQTRRLGCDAISDMPFDFRVAALLKAVTQTPETSWTLTSMAKFAGVSPSRLRTLTHTAAGMSPNKCVKYIRLRHALKLIFSTNLSVKAIGADVGMADTSHFVRDFKALFGMCPGQLATLARDPYWRFGQQIVDLANTIPLTDGNGRL